MINVGDTVRITEGGVPLFKVLEVDDGRALIEAVEEAPGRYPFSMPLGVLVKVEDL